MMSTTPSSREILIVAGEASGDLHGGRLAAELAGVLPEAHLFGLGGEEMRRAGVETLADSAELAVMGISEVVRMLGRAREIFHRLLTAVHERRPRLAVLIDFPDFNLRLASELVQLGIPVVYYVSPQLWAWRRGRVKTISRVVDKMLVLFPFEAEFYHRHAVNVVHVGHPLVDEVPEIEQVWDRGGPSEGPFRLCLLPGSRRGEVERLLPVMLDAVRLLSGSMELEARVIRASTIPRAWLEETIAARGLSVPVVEGEASQRFRVVADSHLALCASGTATLEVGLLRTPMLVLYRLAGWTHLVARLLVRLPWVSLVNLVLDERAVPELLQSQARPEGVAAEVRELLGDPRRLAVMRERLGNLRSRLGEGGASHRAALEVAAVWQAGVARPGS